MASFFPEVPHRRFNPLTGDWVLVSPHRSNRPWQGQVEPAPAENRPPYDPACYLCPGNIRANGERTPQYADVFVFTNDFSALLPDVPVAEQHQGLLRAAAEPGLCRVVCFSPRHDLTIPEMDEAAVGRVVELWQEEYKTLGALPYVRYVQIFENKGTIMGCSNPHPHGQVWAQRTVPQEPLKKQKYQAAYFRKNGRTLLTDYLAQELPAGERIIFENEHFVALVPFWAVWPFEAFLLPKRPMARITDLSASERTDFAAAYRRITIRYDNLFESSFPYSAGIHQAPTDGKKHAEWHWHMVFYPPLLRSATVKKFMVGYEMLAAPQRDITPEKAAELLRALADVHYKLKD
ncbi:MAG: UDP-glucose--hexose-1-phosphate uridylyltransferase [Saprospiraceae bacterium]